MSSARRGGAVARPAELCEARKLQAAALAAARLVVVSHASDAAPLRLSERPIDNTCPIHAIDATSITHRSHRESMAKLALCLALAPVAAGFVAPASTPAGTALHADRAIIGDDGIQAPVGYFDPLKLAEKVNDKTLLWFRAAEIKHCRVAMAAFAGCVVTGLGVHWPGAIDMSGTTFESLGQGGLLEAWDKMPFDGKQAIVAAIGGIESVFEAQKPHYVMGGTPGKVRLTGTTKGALEDKYDAATLKKKRDMELANGRLAMLGMAGFVSARLTEGSVPALTKLGFAADYSGNLPYAPF